MSQTRTTAADLARLLNDADSPVYVLDEDRKIVFCNAACARWTHVAAGELLDLQCVYHAPANADDGSDVAAGLCPPPKVFAGHAQAGVVTCPCRTGAEFIAAGFSALGRRADGSRAGGRRARAGRLPPAHDSCQRGVDRAGPARTRAPISPGDAGVLRGIESDWRQSRDRPGPRTD